MYLPTTVQEMKSRGWDRCDIIFITGDSYIDSPFIGVALLGRVLEACGYRVGIIAQPDVHSEKDITRLGEPALFWGVSGGSVDSMVANFTAGGRKRRNDDYTPGGDNNRRPDRAVIVYANLIRRYFKPTRPILLGGIEASLRRVAHYDYWSNRIRGSILFDSKADYLIYGMGEKPIVEFAAAMRDGADPRTIRSLCYISREIPPGYLELPDFESAAQDKRVFTEMFHTFYHNNDPVTARGLVQRHRDRLLVQNPPAIPPTQIELDGYYAMPFERGQHPYYEQQGSVRALETIRFSINTHRGCYGECNFCAIAIHEGRTVHWRSPESILDEARKITALPDFKGYILDVGGPTANMYGFECSKKLKQGACPDKRCLYPSVCPALPVDHRPQIYLLRSLRRLPGVKKVFVASGLRCDLLAADQTAGEEYLHELVDHHVSGQLKIAPEHTRPEVLKLMGKPPVEGWLWFKNLFDRFSRQAGKPQFLTYYFIAAHPGCSEEDMRTLRKFALDRLKVLPEQVQIFTPTPSTYSSLMFWTGENPFTGEPLFVERELAGKIRQKDILTRQDKTKPPSRKRPVK